MADHTIIVLVANSPPARARETPNHPRGDFPWKGLAGLILALAALTGAAATLVPQLKGHAAAAAVVTPLPK